MVVIPIPVVFPITMRRDDTSIHKDLARLMLMVAPRQPQPTHAIMAHNAYNHCTKIYCISDLNHLV